jgi:hypothetical protein
MINPLRKGTIYLYAGDGDTQILRKCTNITYTGTLISFLDDNKAQHIFNGHWEVVEEL